MTATTLLVIFSTVLGLAVGSFLNVVVWRLPRGEKLTSPPSACPRCQHSIRWHDNVPVLGWLLLRGRCRDCSEPIAARYPLVEASTAIAFGVTAAVIGAALLAIASAGTGNWGAFAGALAGGAALFVFYFIIALVQPRGMGMGDVKLAAVLGLYLGWLGWGVVAVGAFAAFLLGGVFAIALLIIRRAGRRTAIPFGPWMIAGAWVGIAFGSQLWNGYMVATGLA